jgi:proteasome lid subunit RPN8/RPN11
MSTANRQSVSQLLLPATLRRQIIAQAIQALPQEAVGFVAGRGSRADTLIPLPNIAGHHAFLADPYSQFQAEREIKRSGLEIVGIYHSHPDGCGCASLVDKLFGQAWDCVHLIVSLSSRNTAPAAISAHRFVDGEAVTIALPEE